MNCVVTLSDSEKARLRLTNQGPGVTQQRPQIGSHASFKEFWLPLTIMILLSRHWSVCHFPSALMYHG